MVIFIFYCSGAVLSHLVQDSLEFFSCFSVLEIVCRSVAIPLTNKQDWMRCIQYLTVLHFKEMLHSGSPSMTEITTCTNCGTLFSKQLSRVKGTLGFCHMFH